MVHVIDANISMEAVSVSAAKKVAGAEAKA